MNKSLDELISLRKEYQKNSNAILEVKILEEICCVSKEKYGIFSKEYTYYLNELAGSLKYIGE